MAQEDIFRTDDFPSWMGKNKVFGDVNKSWNLKRESTKRFQTLKLHFIGKSRNVTLL